MTKRSLLSNLDSLIDCLSVYLTYRIQNKDKWTTYWTKRSVKSSTSVDIPEVNQSYNRRMRF